MASRGELRKFWFQVSNRIEPSAHTLEVSVDSAKGERFEIGSNPDLPIVLDGLNVASLAAWAIWRQGSWWIRSVSGPCKLDGHPLSPGRLVRLEPGQEVEFEPFTVVMTTVESAPVSRSSRELDDESNDLIGAIHADVLSKLPADSAAAGDTVRDEKLLDVEHLIENVSKTLLAKLRPDVVERLAGRCARDALLWSILEARESEGRLALSLEEPFWTRMASVNHGLENDFQKLINSARQVLGLGPDRSVRDRIERIDRSYWVAWSRDLRQSVDDVHIAYLALRFLKKEVKDRYFGLGVLQDLLRLPTIGEIMVNRFDQIIVDHDGVMKDSGRRFHSEKEALGMIQRVVALVGRQINTSQPMVDARLPNGWRVNAVIPPLAVNGACMTIRKPADGTVNIDRLIQLRTFSPAVARVLLAAVKVRSNILVSGGTSSGKTTTLGCLAGTITPAHRLITIEDTAELRIDHNHVIRFEVKEKNNEGVGAFTVRDLVRNALRMRPDRIIVGECRGPEALDMLQAMNTGHNGSLSSIHANSPADVIGRLEVMVRQAVDLPSSSIFAMIASALDLIIHLEVRPTGKHVVELTEVDGYDDRAGRIRLRPLFKFDDAAGELRPTGTLPRSILELITTGGLPLEMFHD